ncbi:MAG: hypothetical protein CM1200mP24_10240 [Gammaproteobacteria bacterium]|nr:MAG: hypothetical protein CM1200mP24_10240 [Gammaproteobacteria bacterium]
MASAEKFCKLLVECAEQHFLLLGLFHRERGADQRRRWCSVLHGGHKRSDLKRFVRDYDLPVIVFGWGGLYWRRAKGSFVTHFPLCKPYYFSGSNISVCRTDCYA